MRDTIDVLEALFFIYGGTKGIRYLTGRVKYSGKRGEEITRRVEKYKFVLIICSIAMLIGGLAILTRALPLFFINL